MANILGKVFMTPKDEWVLTNTYEKLDIVTVTGENETSAYIAKEDIPASTQITDSKWMKLFTVTNGVDGTNGTDGQNGTDGAPGAAAGFGTPTATVDNNTGIPSVTVTTSGEDTAKVFNFEFKNLKGEKGDTGATGATGANGQDGATGATGADGKSVTAITLTKDSTGAITGGTATLSDQSQITITVTTEEETA